MDLVCGVCFGFKKVCDNFVVVVYSLMWVGLAMDFFSGFTVCCV